MHDCGGSNGYRTRAWKHELQTRFCNRFDLTITVCHYPPGTSKWNPIEHRLFSEISKNWAGQPLESYELLKCRALRTLLRKRKIATLDELKQALGTDVNMTVFRKLAGLSYRTSYSHAGRYYTLDEIARFNDRGLWSHRAVWFSRHGTLLATLDALVSAAEAGYFAQELKACLHVEVKAALLQLIRDGRLVREKLGGLYLYCAADARVRTQQLTQRRAREATRPPGGEADIAELTDEVRAAIILFFSVLEEQQHRLFAGLEALQFGVSDRWIADLLGVHDQTVAKGRQDLLGGDVLRDRSRRPGGGRRPVGQKRPSSLRTSKPS